MENLIKVTTNKNGEGVVSARELHAFLGVGKDFSNWIKDRIEKYELVENQDFEVFAKIGENPNGGRPRTEYALTLDCAKELSMVEGNEKGKQARRYFIECEKKLKEISRFPQVRDPKTTALIEVLIKQDLLEQEQERLALEQARQAGELAGIADRVALVEAKGQPDNEHYSVMGWAKLTGFPLPHNLASKLGKACTKLSDERGMYTGKVSDPRYGAVKTYHSSVLDAVFDDFFSDEPLM